MNDYWSRFLSALRGEQRQPIEDEQRVAECWSSGMLTTAGSFPAPITLVSDYYQSSTGDYSALPGEVYALKEAGRALLGEVDEHSLFLEDWGRPFTEAVVERFRDLVEPK